MPPPQRRTNGSGMWNRSLKLNEYRPSPAQEEPKGSVHAAGERRGGGGGTAVQEVLARADSVAPKSSCVALLRRRSDHPPSPYLLVVALHLASAPPSDSPIVALRRLQLHALLEEVGGVCDQLRARGCPCKVLVGGDFNAVREELVYGNGDDFFACKAVSSTRPPWQRPLPGSEVRLRLSSLPALLCILRPLRQGGN